jgi:hypothetical protein
MRTLLELIFEACSLTKENNLITYDGRLTGTIREIATGSMKGRLT